MTSIRFRTLDELPQIGLCRKHRDAFVAPFFGGMCQFAGMVIFRPTAHGNYNNSPNIIMRTLLNSRVFSLILMLLVSSGIYSQAKADWGPYFPIGNGISVSVNQVTRTIWTWKMRNDTPLVIKYMTFSFGDLGGYETDTLPGSLYPGRAIGGWSAFTSNGYPQSFRVTHIEFR